MSFLKQMLSESQNRSHTSGGKRHARKQHAGRNGGLKSFQERQVAWLQIEDDSTADNKKM